MRRQTKSRIDAEILDCAAGIFARHGFARTSLQQIADAVKYSKAGLLHHYPSKKALFEAVLEKYEAQARDELAKIRGFPPGIERDRVMIESAVDSAFDRPGMAELAQHFAREGVDDDPRFIRLGLDLIAVLGINLAAPDMERMMRAFSALSGVNFAARIAVTVKLEREWRDHIVAAAMAALGHDVEPAPTG
ncbi:TetR/AcrR family transcriptional regulator [Sphingopyxis panaciterrae]